MRKALLTRGLEAWERMCSRMPIPYWNSKECYGHGWAIGYQAALRDAKKQSDRGVAK